MSDAIALTLNGWPGGTPTAVLYDSTYTPVAGLLATFYPSNGGSTVQRLTATVPERFFGYLDVSAGGALQASFAINPFSSPAVAGGGAFTYTVTASDDAGTPALISGANISLTNGATVLQATTNGSGVATFNVNAGTWVVAAAKSGYTYGGSSIVVTANGNSNITMHIVAPPASPPAGQTVGYLYTQVFNTPISYWMTAVPFGSGLEFDGRQYTVSSDPATGYWSANLYKGATYSFKAGAGPTVTDVVIPSGAGTTTALANLRGAP